VTNLASARHAALLATAWLAVSQTAYAQATGPNGDPANASPTTATIATDRPAITDSSAVVASRAVLVENGWLYSSNQPGQVIDFPESLIRVGVGPSTEVRFTVPDYFLGSSGLSQTGFGDLELGIKQQIPHPPLGFQASAVVSLSFPTGANAISSHGYDPSFQLPWSRPLSTNWTAAGMLSIYVPTQNGSHTVVGEFTFLVDRQLTKAWDVFTEYVADFPQAGGSHQLLHFGTAYKLGMSQQVDVHGAIGLSAAVDHFIGIGYSFLLQGRKRR
jgi:hypothetical protein